MGRPEFQDCRGRAVTRPEPELPGSLETDYGGQHLGRKLSEFLVAVGEPGGRGAQRFCARETWAQSHTTKHKPCDLA